MSYAPSLTVDPTAGVTLVRRELCPRCGYDKGQQGHVRPGLCTTCSRPMTPAERAAWA